MKNLNGRQRENLATFYNNLALVLLTAGVITPIFTGFANQLDFSIKLLSSLIGTIFFLQFSLDFLK
jgi:hypothetical protein